ncbi:MAG: hypothetical protein QNJ55_00505 [Xenococcus sp. MO_188.B8]|nr:hypothetical protein [Xenococcus sp. MO_188.B8]
MMAKDITTSELEFVLFEEVSNEAAEAISGGIELEGAAGFEVDLVELPGVPLELLKSSLEAISGLAEFFGLPAINELVSLNEVAGVVTDILPI